MKKVFVFICCLVMSCVSQIKAGENWLCVYPDQTTYFEDADKLVYTLRIDSTRDKGNTLYPFSDFRETDNGCYSATSGSWIARRIVLDENKNTTFITGADQAFFIKNKGLLNETWEAFSNEQIKINATITSAEPQTVLGTTDSVKTVAFSAFDKEGKPVSHLMNGQTIEISKTFGLLKTLNFYRFEHNDHKESDIPLGEFKLAGIKEPQMGFVPMNRKEQYYDFQAGDEFHIYYLDEPMGTFQRVESKTINTYLSRTDYADSIVYTYESKVMRTERQEDKTVNTTHTTDIIRQKIEKGLLFTTEPNEPYEDNHEIRKIMVVNDKLPKMYIWDSFAMWNEETECYTLPVIDNCFIQDYYAPGLGYVPGGCCEIFDNKRCHELVYYKKGSVEAGTPLDLTSRNELVVDKNFHTEIKDGVLNIVFESEQETSFILYDICGNAHRQLTANGSVFNMPIGSLPVGMYLLKITRERERSTNTEKIIIK